MITHNIGIIQLKISHELSNIFYSEKLNYYMVRISFLNPKLNHPSDLTRTYYLDLNEEKAKKKEKSLFGGRNKEFLHGDDVIVIFDTDTNLIIAIGKGGADALWYDVNDNLAKKPFSSFKLDISNISVYPTEYKYFVH